MGFVLGFGFRLRFRLRFRIRLAQRALPGRPPHKVTAVLGGRQRVAVLLAQRAQLSEALLEAHALLGLAGRDQRRIDLNPQLGRGRRTLAHAAACGVGRPRGF